jgi:NhaA family Na+:H+ antiporter
MTELASAPQRPPSLIRDFLNNEAAGGIVLMVVAAAAIIVANSPLAPAYFGALHAYVGGLSVLHWINDALMAVFFLLVGLEIKREMLDGQLATWSRRALPGIGAIGGMAVPAAIYVAFNAHDPTAIRGWAIPSATDIAFALGVLALLGKRVPVSLKVFLAALAIMDDLGAVLIIAVFYTADLNVLALAAAAAILAVLTTMNMVFRIRRLAPYLLLGVPLWAAVFSSGVHATVAGVLLALTIPLRETPARPDTTESPLHRLEHAVAPWSAFLIVPVFGFANAGVSFAGMSPANLLAPVPLGVAAGLFLGKQLGVFAFAWAAIKAGLADLPANATWKQLYGVALLCGIGFTMSLFIGLLAFPDDAARQDAVKLGVLVGSGLSGLLGWLLLRLTPPSPPAPDQD